MPQFKGRILDSNLGLDDNDPLKQIQIQKH